MSVGDVLPGLPVPGGVPGLAGVRPAVEGSRDSIQNLILENRVNRRAGGGRADNGTIATKLSKRRSPALLFTVWKMFAALLTVGALAALLAGQVLPLVVVAAVADTIWHVARALEE